VESSKEEEASQIKRVTRKRWWYGQCLSGGLWKLKIEMGRGQRTQKKERTQPSVIHFIVEQLLERRDGRVKSVIREVCTVYMLCGWRRFLLKIA
jgi:hypothetical protein